MWIIEARTALDHLDFADPQPEHIFGRGAIVGMSEDAIAQVVFRHKPGAILTGDSIALWPRLINPRFTARRKTW